VLNLLAESALEERQDAIARVERTLRQAYGRPRHHNKHEPLSELVFIVLSTQTREAEYRRTFSALWRRYRSWDRIRTAPAEEVESLIRFGGFAKRKVAMLKSLLSRIHADRGITSLRFLRGLSDDDAMRYLLSLPGVGPKTARCVLMYSLDRQVFPVDTHAWRISTRLGWVSGGKHPDDRRSEDLERMIHPALRYSLHVTMVAHGRSVCRARPLCDRCVISRWCDAKGQGSG